MDLGDQQFKNLVHQATVGIVVLLGDDLKVHVPLGLVCHE